VPQRRRVAELSAAGLATDDPTEVGPLPTAALRAGGMARAAAILEERLPVGNVAGRLALRAGACQRGCRRKHESRAARFRFDCM
jgi:hypothetical protein